MAGWIYVPTPDVAEMLDAQRKFFYPQHRAHSNDAIMFLKVEATKAGYDQAIKAAFLKYPTGNRAVTASEGFNFDEWTHLEMRVTVNTAFDQSDGIVQVWKNGTLILNDSAAVMCRDASLTNGYRRFKVGDQVNHIQNDKTITYTEHRLWDDVKVSTQRIGPG
jgi:hypothetical protein